MSRLSRAFVTAFVVAGLTLIGVSAFAQPGPGGRGPGFGPGMGPMGGQGSTLMLLRLQQVQKELELVDDQKTKLNELANKFQTEMRDMFSGLRDLSAEERDKKMAELRPKLEEKTKALQGEVEKILLPNQLARVKEIGLQVRGIAALSDAEVATALGLTADQKEKIAAIQKDARDEMQKAFAGMRDLSQEERRTQMREKLTKSQKDVEEKTLAVLTQEQKDKFEKMKGAKFTLDRSLMAPPGRGGPGGAGGQN